MTKAEMRTTLDKLILETYKIAELLEELRLEMHNRPRQTNGKATSQRADKQRILRLHEEYPDLPQHDIARIVGTNPGRVSEIIAGKRT